MASTNLKKEEGIIIPIIKEEVTNKPKPIRRKVKPILIKPEIKPNNIKLGTSTIFFPQLSPKTLLPGNHSNAARIDVGGSKKAVKILPKPSLGFSIGNLVSNNGVGGARTYFIVTNLPVPLPKLVAATTNNVKNSTSVQSIEESGRVVSLNSKKKEQYDCVECGMLFSFKNTLAEHMKQKHNKKRDVFQCEFCDKEFRRKHLLQSHIKSRHDQVCYMKCTKCDEDFQSSKLLNNHLETKHKEKYYTCPDCKMEFNLRNTMMNHIKSVHRKEKSFQCNQCDARYSWKKNLNIHIDAEHKNLPQFKCNQCTSIFRWKTSLVHHLKAAHKTEESSKYPCADCTLSFTSERRLNFHRKKIHKDKFAVQKSRRAHKSKADTRVQSGSGAVQETSPSDYSGSDSESSEGESALNSRKLEPMEIYNDPSESYTVPDISLTVTPPSSNRISTPMNHANNYPFSTHTSSPPAYHSHVITTSNGINLINSSASYCTSVNSSTPTFNSPRFGMPGIPSTVFNPGGNGSVGFSSSSTNSAIHSTPSSPLPIVTHNSSNTLNTHLSESSLAMQIPNYSPFYN